MLMEKQAGPNDYPQMLFMLRKRPFTDAELKEISQNWTQANPVIMPGGTAPPLIADVLAGRKTLEQYDAASPRYVSAVWDDSPFYFAIDRPFRMPSTIAERLVKWLLAPSVGLLAVVCGVWECQDEKRRMMQEESVRSEPTPDRCFILPPWVLVSSQSSLRYCKTSPSWSAIRFTRFQFCCSRCWLLAALAAL